MKLRPAPLARRRFGLERRFFFGLFVERFGGHEQPIELFGRKAGEVVEVLGLAAEFLDGKHSRAVVCPYPFNYARGFLVFVGKISRRLRLLE